MFDDQARSGPWKDPRRSAGDSVGHAPAPLVADRGAVAELPAAIPTIGFSLLGLVSTIERWPASRPEAR